MCTDARRRVVMATKFCTVANILGPLTRNLLHVTPMWPPDFGKICALMSWEFTFCSMRSAFPVHLIIFILSSCIHAKICFFNSTNKEFSHCEFFFPPTSPVFISSRTHPRRTHSQITLAYTHYKRSLMRHLQSQRSGGK